MISNLTNNMIVCLTTKSSEINNMDDQIQVDIDTIISNAKNDKRFHKLLTLCIKYDIHIFNQSNNVCTILDINNLLIQSEDRQKKLTLELSEKISKLSRDGPINDWLVDIEYIYIEYRKKFKDIQIIIYVLKNIFTDNLLQTLCCITNTSSSSNSNKQTNLKKKDISKYIAVYTN